MVFIEQQYVRNPFVKIKYDKTIAKIFILLIICIYDFINKTKSILTECFLKTKNIEIYF